MVLIAFFIALISIFGIFVNIYIPFVPITGQTLAVMLSGCVLGAYRGAIANLLLIVMVLFGMPLLSGGVNGVAAILGHSGGFIISWPIAAFIIGYFAQKKYDSAKKQFIFILFACIFGGIVIVYLVGSLWFIYYNISLKLLIAYLPGDLIKSFLATYISINLFKYIPEMIPSQR